MIKFRSTIHSDIKRKVLFKGTLLALLGLIPLLFSAFFLPPQELQYFGLPLFILTFLLITLGLLPYKKISSLEKKPDEILITDDEQLHFISKSKKLFSFPLSSIEKLHYISDRNRYGIEIVLNKKTLFLPYFSKYSFEQLNNLLKS